MKECWRTPWQLRNAGKDLALVEEVLFSMVCNSGIRKQFRALAEQEQEQKRAVLQKELYETSRKLNETLMELASFRRKFFALQASSDASNSVHP